MKIEIEEIGDTVMLVYSFFGRAGMHVSPMLTEHDLNDLEFVLATRKAMSKRCTATEGEHTCAYAPDHGLISHHCRGCNHQW